MRISAGEVRKRLAQYYQEVTDPAQLRIELPVGSYRPEFIAAIPAARLLPSCLHQSFACTRGADLASTSHTRQVNEAWWRRAIVALAAVLAGLPGLYVASQADRAGSILESSHPARSFSHAVPGTQQLPGRRSGGRIRRIRPIRTRSPWPGGMRRHLRAGGAGPIEGRFASTFSARIEATFSDFQQRPAVLIGAYNDQWTLELMSRMRYTFQRTARFQWIADRDRPSFQDWKNDLGQTDGQGNLALKQDYAIISRVENPRTGFITVTVAGLWGYGTLAAGRFLTDPPYIQEFCRRTGFNFDKTTCKL